MLTHVAFQNFKSLADVAMDLSPFTLIVGKNGSGKTSVLEGIHYISQIGLRRRGEEKRTTGRLGVLFDGPRAVGRLLTKPYRGPMQIAVTDDEEATLSLRAWTTSKPGDSVYGDHFLVALDGEQREVSPDGGIGEAAQLLDSPRARRFCSAVFLRLDARALARPSVWDEEPRLEYDGEGLASVLSYLAGAERSTLDAITSDLASVVPRVNGILTFPATVTRKRSERIVIGDQAVNRTFDEQVTGHRLALDMGRGRVIPADMLSEGTLLTLGLLVALRQPQAPKLVLADDIDKALHPSAQAELVRCLRSIMTTRTDMQIICTTHSPDLLDNAQLEEIRVMTLDADGHAACRSLAEHPESQRWRSMLRTGEFWGSVGEEWVLKAEKPKE